MILKRISTVLAAAAAGTILLAGTSFAAVDFDPATGMGSVGKGDVQIAFGLNNAQFQQQAGNVKFLSKTVTVTEVVCESTAGRKTTRKEKEERTNTKSVIAYDLRQKKQIVGYTLTGLESTTLRETGGCSGGAVEVEPTPEEAALIAEPSTTGALVAELGSAEAELHSF